MEIKPIKLEIMSPPKDGLMSKLDKVNFDIKERDCVVVTSKVVAIDEGRCIPVSEVKDKQVLVEREADVYLPASENKGWNLSIKNNAFISSAGIDESNANGHYVLLPKDSMLSAKRLWEYFKNRFSLNELAVVISDSHATPFRFGTMGVALGWWGFKPVTFFEGSTDLFGRPFKYSRVNVADSLAVVGVFSMGETDEQTPIAIIRDIPHIQFVDETSGEELLISPKDDMYYELLRPFFEK